MRMKWLCFSLALGLIGCGLDDGGVVDVTPGIDVDSSAPDVIVVSEDGKQPDNFVPTDAPVQPEAGPDTSWPCGVDPTSCANTSVIPNGWKAVAVASTNLACGAGFDKETHVKTSPAASVGACDCVAANQVPPSCLNGKTFTFTGALCVTPAAMINVSTNTCTGINGSLSVFYASTTVPPSGGSCNASAVTDLTKVNTADLTVCEAVTCPEKVCAGTPPNGFQACIETAGDVACPNGSPFNKKQTLGDAATLSCAACSSCTASAMCDMATLEFFTDNLCTNSVATFTSDGVCQATGNASATVRGFIYKANTKNLTYTPTGPKTATVGLSNAQTICCR